MQNRMGELREGREMEPGLESQGPIRDITTLLLGWLQASQT